MKPASAELEGHAPTQVRQRDDLAVDQRDGAALAHEGAFTIRVVRQQPVDDALEELEPLRGLILVFGIEGPELGLRRARRPIQWVPPERVLVEAGQSRSARLIASPSKLSSIAQPSFSQLPQELEQPRGRPHSRRCQVVWVPAHHFLTWCRRYRGRNGPS
jgi:hypothetical protein